MKPVINCSENRTIDIYGCVSFNLRYSIIRSVNNQFMSRNYLKILCIYRIEIALN